MTEKEFEQRIENAADRFEKHIEKAADKLENSITAKWNKHKYFRIAIKSLSLIVELSLLVIGGHFFLQGNIAAAVWCLLIGIVGMLADITIAVIFRRKP